MKLADALADASRNRPLDKDRDRQLRGLIGKLRSREFVKLGKLRFNRRRHVEDAIINLLNSNGKGTHVSAATDQYGEIDWQKLLELLIQYLPQILTIIISII